MVTAENICLESSGRSATISFKPSQARNHWTVTCKVSPLLFGVTAALDLQPLLQPLCRVQAVPCTSLCHFDLGSLITIRKKLTWHWSKAGGREGAMAGPGEVGGSSSPAADDLW